MALKVENGRLRVGDDFEGEEEVRPPRNFKRSVMSHLAVICLTAVMCGGLSLQDRAQALNDAKDTFEQLATYSGCAARDGLGNFYWHPFPTTTAEDQAQQQPTPKHAAPAKRSGQQRVDAAPR